jgi:hypothetical protein
MTVFVDHLSNWTRHRLAEVENYVEWLVANVGPNHNTEWGLWDDWQRVGTIDQQIDMTIKWEQMCDNYWCLREEVVNSDIAICSLTMHYGTGWHVMHQRGIQSSYLFNDDIVIVVYDESQALQFKLACL